MTLTNSTEDASVTDLLEHRARLQGWLDRLGEVGADVSPRVVERVRADYDERLSNVLRELGSHDEAIRADLERLRGELNACGERYENAVEVLEEVKLRYRIGELEEAEWDERRPGLEEDVSVSAGQRDEASSELARLEDILAQIEEARAQSQVPIEELTIASDAVGVEIDAADVEGSSGHRDLAFLEELDRAIQGESDDAAYTFPDVEDDSAPTPGGTKCADCGYTNDVGARYCGVCGADLA